jgi:hypothetical protein
MSEPFQSYDEGPLTVRVGLILLSLDSVADRFEQLNISFQRPDVVKRAARSVLEWLEQFPYGTHGSNAMIRQLADALENAGDPEDARRAAAWLTRFNSMRKCDGLANYWGPVLLLLNDDYAMVLRQLGMRAESVALLCRLSDRWGNRLSEIESLTEVLGQSVKSDWDRAQYREYQKESDLVTPINFLSAWLSAEGFLTIMRTIVDQLEPLELKLFEAWGQATASVQTWIPESSLSLENINDILSSCSEG